MSRKMGKSAREAFGLALANLGQSCPDIVVVDGDVNNSTRTELFAKKFAARFFNVGIAESNLVGVTAGLASSGKQAWVSSFSAFVICNAYDQLRMSVAFPNIDVKVVGTHAGISIGEDGPSQMGIEDVSLACSLPNFTVVVPSDEISTEKAVQALGAIKTPAYLRAGRPNLPLLYESGCDFHLGKAIQLRDGKNVAIIANGLMVAPALDAAEALAKSGIQARVLDMHTVKPCDDPAILAAAKETGRIVVAEEHLAHGGVGSAVAMSASRQHPGPMRVGNLGDAFGGSGNPAEIVKDHPPASQGLREPGRRLA